MLPQKRYAKHIIKRRHQSRLSLYDWIQFLILVISANHHSRSSPRTGLVIGRLRARRSQRARSGRHAPLVSQNKRARTRWLRRRRQERILSWAETRRLQPNPNSNIRMPNSLSYIPKRGLLRRRRLRSRTWLPSSMKC